MLRAYIYTIVKVKARLQMLKWTKNYISSPPFSTNYTALGTVLLIALSTHVISSLMA